MRRRGASSPFHGPRAAASAPGRGPRTIGRRLLLASPMGMLGPLAVAACSPEPEPGDEFLGLGDEPEVISAGPHVRFDRPQDPGAVLLPGGRLHLAKVAQVESFTAGEVSVMSSRSKRTETPSDHPVPAPEGAVFLVLELGKETGGDYTLFAPVLPAGQEAPEEPSTSATIILRGADGESSSTEIALDDAVRGLLMHLPSEPSAQDAVLEVVADGATQRLSLVDGTLLETDLSHVRDWKGGVEVGVPARGSASARVLSEDGMEHHLMLSLERVEVGMHVEGWGWAPEGSQFLWVELTIDQILEAADEGSGQRYGVGHPALADLTLEDGSTIEPFLLGFRDGDPGPAEELTSGGVTWWGWFEIPAPIGSARLRLAAVLDERSDGPAPAPDDPDSVSVEADLAFG